MKENPLGGKAVMPIKRNKPGQTVTMLWQIGVGHRQQENHPTGLQRSVHHGGDVLPLAEGIRRFKDGPGEAIEGTGKKNGKLKRLASKSGIGQTDPQGYCGGTLLSLEQRRCAVEHASEEYEVGERQAAWLVVPKGFPSRLNLPLR
jgi:hypothetical protein